MSETPADVRALPLLHQALINKLGDRFDNWHTAANERGAALRAVVELHRPEPYYTIDQQNVRSLRGWYCSCKGAPAYPCDETKVIAASLGVETQP